MIMPWFAQEGFMYKLAFSRTPPWWMRLLIILGIVLLVVVTAGGLKLFVPNPI